ncbi:UNVERIFIED_ORG: hypothetical protein LHJ69_23715 [Shinella sp. XGS7]|nr:hypothetical protein [Shinella sp. XGS7]
MKSPRHRITPRTYSALVQRGGCVALPPDLSTFRLGQRVYFHVRGKEIAFQAKPKRAVRGRLLSNRIRRTVRTLAAFGPRTRDASRAAA